MTGYTRLELGDCAKELLLHQQAAQADLQTVRNKFSRNFLDQNRWGRFLRLRAETTPHIGGE